MALICLHISTFLYVLLGIGLVAFARWMPDDPEEPLSTRIVFMGAAVFCVLLAAVPEIAAMGIRRRRFWGWVLSLILFGLYVPSLFMPLGAFGLWGLLDAGSRAEMGVDSNRGTPVVT